MYYDTQVKFSLPEIEDLVKRSMLVDVVTATKMMLDHVVREAKTAEDTECVLRTFFARRMSVQLHNRCLEKDRLEDSDLGEFVSHEYSAYVHCAKACNVRATATKTESALGVRAVASPVDFMKEAMRGLESRGNVTLTPGNPALTRYIGTILFEQHIVRFHPREMDGEAEPRIASTAPPNPATTGNHGVNMEKIDAAATEVDPKSVETVTKEDLDKAEKGGMKCAGRRLMPNDNINKPHKDAKTIPNLELTLAKQSATDDDAAKVGDVLKRPGGIVAVRAYPRVSNQQVLSGAMQHVVGSTISPTAVYTTQNAMEARQVFLGKPSPQDLDAVGRQELRCLLDAAGLQAELDNACFDRSAQKQLGSAAAYHAVHNPLLCGQVPIGALISPNMVTESNILRFDKDCGCFGKSTPEDEYVTCKITVRKYDTTGKVLGERDARYDRIPVIANSVHASLRATFRKAGWPIDSTHRKCSVLRDIIVKGRLYKCSSDDPELIKFDDWVKRTPDDGGTVKIWGCHPLVALQLTKIFTRVYLCSDWRGNNSTQDSLCAAMVGQKFDVSPCTQEDLGEDGKCKLPLLVSRFHVLWKPHMVALAKSDEPKCYFGSDVLNLSLRRHTDDRLIMDHVPYDMGIEKEAIKAFVHGEITAVRDGAVYHAPLPAPEMVVEEAQVSLGSDFQKDWDAEVRQLGATQDSDYRDTNALVSKFMKSCSAFPEKLSLKYIDATFGSSKTDALVYAIATGAKRVDFVVTPTRNLRDEILEKLQYAKVFDTVVVTWSKYIGTCLPLMRGKRYNVVFDEGWQHVPSHVVAAASEGHNLLLIGDSDQMSAASNDRHFLAGDMAHWIKRKPNKQVVSYSVPVDVAMSLRTGVPRAETIVEKMGMHVKTCSHFLNSFVCIAAQTMSTATSTHDVGCSHFLRKCPAYHMCFGTHASNNLSFGDTVVKTVAASQGARHPYTSLFLDSSTHMLAAAKGMRVVALTRHTQLCYVVLNKHESLYQMRVVTGFSSELQRYQDHWRMDFEGRGHRQPPLVSGSLIRGYSFPVNGGGFYNSDSQVYEYPLKDDFHLDDLPVRGKADVPANLPDIGLDEAVKCTQRFPEPLDFSVPEEYILITPVVPADPLDEGGFLDQDGPAVYNGKIDARYLHTAYVAMTKTASTQFTSAMCLQGEYTMNNVLPKAQYAQPHGLTQELHAEVETATNATVTRLEGNRPMTLARNEYGFYPRSSHMHNMDPEMYTGSVPPNNMGTACFLGSNYNFNAQCPAVTPSCSVNARYCFSNFRPPHEGSRMKIRRKSTVSRIATSRGNVDRVADGDYGIDASPVVAVVSSMSSLTDTERDTKYFGLCGHVAGFYQNDTPNQQVNTAIERVARQSDNKKLWCRSDEEHALLLFDAFQKTWFPEGIPVCAISDDELFQAADADKDAAKKHGFDDEKGWMFYGDGYASSWKIPGFSKTQAKTGVKEGADLGLKYAYDDVMGHVVYKKGGQSVSPQPYIVNSTVGLIIKKMEGTLRGPFNSQKFIPGHGYPPEVLFAKIRDKYDLHMREHGYTDRDLYWNDLFHINSDIDQQDQNQDWPQILFRRMLHRAMGLPEFAVQLMDTLMMSYTFDCAYVQVHAERNMQSGRKDTLLANTCHSMAEVAASFIFNSPAFIAAQGDDGNVPCLGYARTWYQPGYIKWTVTKVGEFLNYFVTPRGCYLNIPRMYARFTSREFITIDRVIQLADSLRASLVYHSTATQRHFAYMINAHHFQTVGLYWSYGDIMMMEETMRYFMHDGLELAKYRKSGFFKSMPKFGAGMAALLMPTIFKSPEVPATLSPDNLFRYLLVGTDRKNPLPNAFTPKTRTTYQLSFENVEPNLAQSLQ